MTEKSFLTLNTGNYVSGSKYQVEFPQSVDFTGCTVSLHSLAMNNSFFNIKAKYNNNRFSIKWINGSIYDFVIPDGYYEFEDLNTFIEQQCLLNGLYLKTNSATKNVFFIRLSVNPSRYRTQLDIYPVPTSAEATTLQYTKPLNTNHWSFPTNATTPQIILSEGLQTLSGMTEITTYPPVDMSSDYSILAKSPPKLLPIYSMYITCNLCDSIYNNYKTILEQVPIDAKYGSAIKVDPKTHANLPIRPGKYNTVEIELIDQNYSHIELNDFDFSLVLLIERPIKK